MLAQTLVVACLVLACATFAAWTLMPASARRTIALALLKLRLPRWFSAVLTKHSVSAAGCACDGCDRSTAPAASTAKPIPGGVAPITFHPRPRR